MTLRENFHTHTARCGHATGADRDYVEAAIAAGFRVLGFSDHAPMPFPDGHESSFRIPLRKLDDYVSSLLALRDEYRADIDIRIGFEVEYYPALWERFLALILPYPIDYLILGEHFIGDETPALASQAPTDDPERLRRFLDLVRAGAETGRFLYVAHPDNLRFTGGGDIYAECVLPFLRRMKELNIPMEINRLGLSTHRHYPSARFFRLCADVGVPVVVGMDAHSPEQLLDPAREDCLALARQAGLEPVESLAERAKATPSRRPAPRATTSRP